MSVIIKSGSSSDLATVNSNKQILAMLGQIASPTQVGAIRIASENDAGTVTGSASLVSPETDVDYRLRTALDTIFEDETFNYTAQNTKKHNYVTATLAMTWNTGGLLTNSGNITTTTTAARVRTYAYFPIFSNGVSTCIQGELSFSANPVANTIVDFGLFIDSGSNPHTPTDGVYFRLNSSGLFGVINHNGSEATTSVFGFSYSFNKVYKYLIVVSNTETEFWINDTLYGVITTPDGQAQPCMSASLPFAVRHTITGGAAGGSFQATLRGYGIALGGAGVLRTAGELGNAVYGSYTGLSGGTMGTLANYANSANPTAAAPTNTTAALGSGLGGQFWETDTLAVTTDGIISSYQVPTPSVSIQGRRLKVTGVRIESYIQTALTGGGYNAQWSLAFGHTAVSLATGESTISKAPVRVPLGVQTVAAGAAALVKLEVIDVRFPDAPIYVNPSEFIAVVKKKVGTAPSAGVVAHLINFSYAWE